MAAFLDGCLPRILPQGWTFKTYSHRGKTDILRKLKNRLSGYATWLPDHFRIVVLVDRDNDKCKELKSELESHCKRAGLKSKQATNNPNWQVVTRIAIEELEAWYFGDWQAVCLAFPRVSTSIPNQAKYRHPDSIKGGTSEAFERILNKYGYIGQGASKVKTASAISQHIDPERSKSHSFKVFRDTLTNAGRGFAKP